MTFDSLELHPALSKAIANLGYAHCTPIQAETLPVSLTGQDVIGKAQTGTGKTAAFLISAFQYMLENPIPEKKRFAGEPRVLVLAPTRELALQIEKDAKGLKGGSKLNVLCTVGGMDYDPQRYALHNYSIDVLVATPGRLIDFVLNRDVFLDQVEILIIDEADRMLDMGFIPDIKRILGNTTPRENRQTLLFSATFNQDVLNLASMWTIQPEYVEIEPESVTADTVEQVIYLVEAAEKKRLLLKLVRETEFDKMIIFTNRRDEARFIESYLRQKRINAALLSGEVTQSRRLKVLERFKKGAVSVLVATDVAGRGLHVNGITHVVNYNLPEDPDDYVHRIGRTGRAGQTGIAISLACEDESFALPDLEKHLGFKLKCEYPADLS
ncbi:MAG: DEAD/DEAH box helicase [Pseudomonadales bacterium]|nr:DEAD/DEAH box helicase [Pseudomonadales bacterium]